MLGDHKLMIESVIDRHSTVRNLTQNEPGSHFKRLVGVAQTKGFRDYPHPAYGLRSRVFAAIYLLLCWRSI